MFGHDSDRDPVGEEMSPSARVWSEYVEAASEYDTRAVDDWNSSVDVILIFAALFSAVLTAFLIESYKLLSPDTDSLTLSVLQEMSETLKSIAADTPAIMNASMSIAEQPPFSPSSMALWVNGLWFTSLTGSLGVSSVAMLIKQWLRAYQSDMAGLVPQTQARLRQRRFATLIAWRMPGLIASLPLLLSVALMEFLGGLVVFLYSLNFTVASSVMVVVSVTLIIHLASLILPALTDCPYKTAASSSIYRILSPLRRHSRLIYFDWRVVRRSLIRSLILPFRSFFGSKHLKRALERIVWFISSLTMVFATIPYVVGLNVSFIFLPIVKIMATYGLMILRILSFWSSKALSALFPTILSRRYYWVTPLYLTRIMNIRPPAVWNRALGSVLQWKRSPTEFQWELRATEDEGAVLDAQAILWLMHASPHERSKEAAVKSVAGVLRNSAAATVLRQGGVLPVLRGALQSCIKSQGVVAAEDVELYARGLHSIHSSTRLLDTGPGESSRTADAALMRPLLSSGVREVVWTGMAAGLMIQEMVELLERYVDGAEVVPTFHLCLVIDTMSYEFASRSRWKGDFWATSDHGWDGWARRIVPRLLDLLKASTGYVHEMPTALDTALAILLSVFACGYGVQDVQALESENKRQKVFYSLVLAAIPLIIKHPVNFGYEDKTPAETFALVVRAWRGLRWRLVRHPEAELGEIVLEERVALNSLISILDAPQEPDVQILALQAISEFPSKVFTRETCVNFLRILTSQPSPEILSSILLCLENLCGSFEQVWSLATYDVLSRLRRVLVTDIRLRYQVFGIIRSMLLTGVSRDSHLPERTSEFLKMLINQGVLGDLRAFFSEPFTLSLQDAQEWVFIMSLFCKGFKKEIVESGALAAMADSTQNFWRAAEVFVDHREAIEGLLMQVGLPSHFKSDAELISTDIKPAIPRLQVRQATG